MKGQFVRFGSVTREDDDDDDDDDDVGGQEFCCCDRRESRWWNKREENIMFGKDLITLDKESWCLWGVRNLYHSASFQCKACNEVALFLLFYKYRLFFCHQSSSTTTKGNVLWKDCGSHVKCQAIISEKNEKSNTATKDYVQCLAQYLLVITVPEKLMFILGRSALSPSCKFLMSSG